MDVFATGRPEIDPTVWSARATVRPVSALRVGFEHSRIVGGAQDFQASLTWVHQFGVPLSRQWRWDGNGRGAGNDLAHRALLPVEREKRIVMDTRERGVPLALATEAVQAQVYEGDAFEHVVAVTGGALPLAYALRGADAALFEMTGDTLRLPGQDAAAPADVGADNVYDVIVVVTDGHGRTVMQPVAVTVLPAGAPDVAGNAPTATPRVTGDLVVGRTVRGEVHFADVDGDAEGEHDYQWFLATDASGEVRFPIPGATGATHAITERDAGAFLVFEVTPRSASGTPATGIPTRAVSGRVNSTPYVHAIGASHPELVVGAEIMLTELGLADLDGDPVTATFKLYRTDGAADAANRLLIEEGGIEVGYRYRIQAADVGKVLVLEVTPSSTQGSSPGEVARLNFRVPAFQR